MINFKDELGAKKEEVLKLTLVAETYKKENERLLRQLMKFGVRFLDGKFIFKSKNTARKSTGAEVIRGTRLRKI